MATVHLQSLTKRYGATTAVDDVSIDIADGELLTLLGPSGCGKTTTLRMVAGLVEPTAGRIHFDDEDVTYLPPRARNIGFVFQTPALFPHLSVADNIGFGLSVKGAAQGRHPRPRRGDARAGRAGRLWRTTAGAAVGRPAAARRARPRARHRPPRPALRRAALGSRQEPARPAQVRDPRPPAADAEDRDLRHARPVRGVRHQRPDRGDERRPGRAGRHPDRDLPPPADPVRGRVHRRHQRVQRDRHRPSTAKATPRACWSRRTA